MHLIPKVPNLGKGHLDFNILTNSTIKVGVVVALLLLLAYVLNPNSADGNLNGELSTIDEPGLASAEAARVDQEDSTLHRTKAKFSADDDAGLGAANAAAAPESDQPLLSGRILDESGNGIGNAWVTTPQEAKPVWADEQGYYSIPLSAEIDRWHPQGVMAWAPNYQLTYLYLSEPGPGDVTLKAALPLNVKVLRGEDDLPIEGASAQVLIRGSIDPNSGAINQYSWIPTPLKVAPSNAEGILTIPGLTFGFILITAPGYSETLLRVRTTPNEWVARLMPTKVLNTRFVLPDGSPLASAKVSIDPAFKVVSTDADGWLTVPALTANGYYNSLTVSWQDKAYLFAYYFRGPNPPYLEHGKEIVVPYREITGSLTISGDAKPEDFELATCGLQGGPGDRPMPNPEKNPDRVSWSSPLADGSFAIHDGWQGMATQIVVRRKADQAVVLKEKLEGDGPYLLALNLDQGNLVTFQVIANPKEALEAMKLKLSPRQVPGQTEKLPAIILENGSAQIRLLPGTWSLSLFGEGFENNPGLGKFVMPDEEHTFTYDLGPMRKVSGRLTAADKPMTAVSLDFYQPGGYFPERRRAGPRMEGRTQFAGFVIRKRIATDGNWDLGWIPDSPMEARFETDNRWLGRGQPFHFDLPPGQGYFDLKLPVATIQFTFEGDQAPAPKDVHIWHSELPEFGGESILFQSVYDSSFPDLSRGVVEQTVSPGKYQIILDDPLQRITPREIVVHEGEYLPVTVRIEAAGEVVALWETKQGRWGGKVIVEATTDSDVSVTPRRFIAKDSNARKGGFSSAYSVPPGNWKFILQGPITGLDDRNARPTEVSYGAEGQTWEMEVEVQAGKRTVVMVGLDADGNVYLRPEILD
jgi:hypothetical protein